MIIPDNLGRQHNREVYSITVEHYLNWKNLNQKDVVLVPIHGYFHSYQDIAPILDGHLGNGLEAIVHFNISSAPDGESLLNVYSGFGIKRKKSEMPKAH